MRHCKILEILIEAIPVKAWQDLLLRRHVERCPFCRARLAGRDEARRVLAGEQDFSVGLNLWPGIKARLAGSAWEPRVPVRPRFGPVRYAATAAALLAAAVVSVWLFRASPGARPEAAPPVEERFEMGYVRVGGRPADSYIFQPQGWGMTLIWAEKKTKGGS